MHVYEMKPGDFAIIRFDRRLTQESADKIAARWADLVGDDGPKMLVIDGDTQLDIVSIHRSSVAADLDRINALAAEQATAIAESVERMAAEIKATSVKSTALLQDIADRLAEGKPAAEMLAAIKALAAAARENGAKLTAMAASKQADYDNERLLAVITEVCGCANSTTAKLDMIRDLLANGVR